MNKQQTIVLGGMTIAIGANVAHSIRTNKSGATTAKVVLGGWLVTAVLLVGADLAPDLAQGAAILLATASLLGPTGSSLLSTVEGVTGGKIKSVTVKGGDAAASIKSGADTTQVAATGDVSDPRSGTTVSAISVADTTRTLLLKSRTIKPSLTPIPGHTNFMLDSSAARSFPKVEADAGMTLAISNTYRTAAQQQNAYDENGGADGPFGTPGTSLHEVALAVDLADESQYTNPVVINAFAKNGWYRRGKRLSDGLPEEWHFTYGVPG